MGETRNKNNIVIWLLVIGSILVGEMVFGIGLYLPILLALGTKKSVYWQGLVVAILLGIGKGVSIGMMGLLIWLAIFIYSFVVNRVRPPWWGLVIYIVSVGWIIDSILGFGYNIFESIVVVVLVWWFHSLGLLKEELRVK